MYVFSAPLELIGVNPFVQLPTDVLAAIQQQAGRHKGPIRVQGTLNGQPYHQTLVRYAGFWRLYVNLAMLANSPRRIGEVLAVIVAYDPTAAPVWKCIALDAALAETPAARLVFEGLAPSRRVEIVRYLARLKAPETLHRNVGRAIGFLLGRNRFVGRDRP